MVRGLLIRGMLVGLAAGVLAFFFAKVFGEPQVDKAIAFEAAHEPAVGRGAAGEPRHAVDARPADRHGRLRAALGGIFALVFAAAYGRIGKADARTTAAVLALVGFTVIFLVPFTKYPSNPPAVGNDETIGYRTKIFFVMIAISVFAAIAALRLGRDFVRRFGAWNGVIAAVGAFIVLIALGELLMPSLDEITEGLPDQRDLALPRRDARHPHRDLGDARPGLRRRRAAAAAAALSAGAGTCRTSSPCVSAPRPARARSRRRPRPADRR